VCLTLQCRSYGILRNVNFSIAAASVHCTDMNVFKKILNKKKIHRPKQSREIKLQVIEYLKAKIHENCWGFLFKQEATR